jgi:hypothetical protein
MAVGDEEDTWMCPICFEAFPDAQTRTLEACHHGFCEGCFIQHFAQHDVCPLCREAASPAELRTARLARDNTRASPVPSRAPSEQENRRLAGLEEAPTPSPSSQEDLQYRREDLLLRLVSRGHEEAIAIFLQRMRSST